MSGEIIENFMRFITIRVEYSCECSGTYSGDNIRFDIMLQKSLHYSQMGKSFNKSSA